MVGLFHCAMRTLAAIFFAVAAFVGCFAQSQPKRYENPDFRLSFRIPKGWTVGDDAAKEAYAKAAGLNPSQRLLLLLTRKEGDAPSERITVLGQHFEHGVHPKIDAAARYVDSWAAAHPNLERDPAIKSNEWDPDGIGRFKTKSSPERWFQIYAMIHLSDFLRVTGEFNSEESLKKSVRVMNGLKLTPDWVNPNEKVSDDDEEDTDAPEVKNETKELISSGTTQGFLKKKVQPEYPEAARRARVQGSVIFRGVISKDGKIAELTTLYGEPILVEAALRAVRQWEYKPYLVNGEAVEVQTLLRVNFALAH
jgi:TonB family protein